MININTNNENGVIDDYFVIYNKTGERPNRITIDDLFDGDEFEKVIDQFKNNSELDNYLTELTPYEDQSVINQKVFLGVSENVWVSYVAINKNGDDFICNNVQIYYNGNLTETIDFVEKLKDSLMSTVFSFEEDENTTSTRLCTLSISTNGLEIEPVSVESISDIEKYYHPDTLKGVNSLIKNSKKVKSGLSFFYGDKGRGKTSILKYISERTDRVVLFIPTNYLEHTINNPDFKNFLKNSKYLLVIDDCDFIFDYPNITLINNIHQLVDGILSESIGVQILMIYNSNGISSTMLRANNIINIVEFKKLSPDQASKLSKNEYTKDINLADIFKKRVKENSRISL